MKKEIACVSLALIYEDARSHGVTDGQIFKGIDRHRDICLNPYEWTSADVWNRMAANIEECLTDDSNPLYNLGRRVLKGQISGFQYFFLKIAPLTIIVQQITAHMKKNIHRSLDTEAYIQRPGLAYIKFKPVRNTSYSTQICRYNQGCTHGVLELKGLRNIKIEEIHCAALSDVASCEYKLTWDPKPSFLERIGRLFLIFRNHRAIIQHMEESHNRLQGQYKEILAIRDFYSHIMQNMHESIVWLNERGYIEFANSSFRELTGKPAGTIDGCTFGEFTYDESSRRKFKQTLQECRDDRESRTVELSISRGDKEERIGETTIVWVESDHRASGFIISIRDITESKQMERKLMLAEDRYRTLYENSPALIIGIDLEGRIIYANPATVEQTGYSEEELRGMHFSTLVAPEADFDTNRLLEKLLKYSSRLQEVHFKTKGGEWKTVAFNSYRIFDETGIGGLAGIGIDISETKRLNEQLIKSHRMELLGQMAGGLAHDFNNIMTAISGYARIISLRSSEEKMRHNADVILRATCRASDLVKKLLSFSRGDTVEMKRFDLSELIKETCALIRGSTSSCIDLNLQMPKEPIFIHGDTTKIHQCILNLGINARDAITPKQNGSITLRLKKSSQDTSRVLIEVEDTGIGIPPDILERVFDPFFSTKKKKEGAGLGLSVVYGIIKAHGGDIYVQSRPGEGATFTIDLPLCEQPSDSSDHSAAKEKTFSS
ncbi:MAG: PAS domain-containing sensor histidine kinase [Fibrobacterota bacterium]